MSRKTILESKDPAIAKEFIRLTWKHYRVDMRMLDTRPIECPPWWNDITEDLQPWMVSAAVELVERHKAKEVA